MPTEHDSNIDMDDILIVDDETANLKLLSEILVKEGYRVRPANKPQLAIDSAMAQPPKLILLDVKMPEMDGFEVCRRLKQDDRTRDTPIIFVSALREAEEKVAGFEAGGVDFISKPFDDLEILARVRTHVNLRNLQLSMKEQVRHRTKEVFASEAKFRSLVENIPDVIWTTDSTGKTVYISDNVQEIFGFSQEEVYALSNLWVERIHPDDVDRVMEEFARLFQTGEMFDVEYRIRHKDGHWIWLHDRSMSRYRKNGVSYADGIFSDITELKEAQSESLKLRLEMAHLNRVMTMNELAASLAHELSQPLGAIANNASAGKFLNSQDVEDREDLNEILEDIARDAQRAGQIIGKIRGVMQKDDSVYATLDINALLDEVVSLYKNSFSLDHVSVLIEKDSDIPLVQGDRVRLQQVLMNLITNAIDAMANSPKKVLKFQTAQSEDMVSVSVRDTGQGIEEDSIDDIFDAFYTTKREGMGIGLRLCRSIIEEHDGRIWVENNHDSGATFYFTVRAFSEEEGHGFA